MEEEVSGEIYLSREGEYDEGTLDEPVLATLQRDLKAIMVKCWHVIVPGRSKTLLHNWDLWGPLLLCLLLGMLVYQFLILIFTYLRYFLLVFNHVYLFILLSILLHGSGHGSTEEPTIHFVHVFVMVWGGAAVVTINAQLLKGKVSFFQCVCTLGYCLLPLTIAVMISRLLLTIPLPSSVVLIIRLVVVNVSLLWAVWASLGFLSDYLPSDRKALAVYPIFLFYFAISCLILAQTNSLL